MAWVFVRLKVALLRSGFAASRGYLVLYLIGTAVALAGGIGVALLLANFLGDGTGQTGEVLLLVALPMVWIVWIIAPLMGGGQAEQTVDPSRLELLPLSFGQQVRGLLITGLLGPAALGTLIGALGPALAAGSSWPTRLVLIAVAVVFVVLCVAWSRSIGASFAGLLDSRRGKELLVVLSVLIIAPLYLITELVTSAAETLAKETTAGWWNLLIILPPGALGRAIAAARDEQWWLTLALLAWGVVGVALALLVWRWALQRRLIGGGGASGATASRRPVGESLLFPAYLRWLPRSAVGATTAKEMRYFFARSTLQLQQLVIGALVALLVVGSQLFSDSSSSDLVVFLGAFVVFMILFQSSSNVFGIDNAAVSTYLLSGVDLAKVLLGKFLALLLIALPVGLVFQIAAVIIRRDYDSLWIGLAAVPVPWLIWLGLGSFVSVVLATPVTTGRRKTSGSTVLGVMGGLFGALAVAGAVIGVSIAIGSALGSEWVGVAAAWVLSALVGVVGLRLASGRLRRDPTRLLERLGGDRL